MAALTDQIALSRTASPARRKPGGLGDGLFRAAAYASALLVLLVLFGILASIAEDARQDGVRHVELSASAPLAEPPEGAAWMAMAEAAAPSLLSSPPSTPRKYVAHARCSRRSRTAHPSCTLAAHTARMQRHRPRLGHGPADRIGRSVDLHHRWPHGSAQRPQR